MSIYLDLAEFWFILLCTQPVRKLSLNLLVLTLKVETVSIQDC